MASEKNLGDELLQLNGDTPDGAAARIVDRIALRERRRMRWWAIATGVAWAITAFYFLALLWAYMVLIHPVVNELMTNEEYRRADLHHHAYALLTGLKALLIWPVLLLLAAACTTIFTLASRRATLRQIQASLKQISEQLETLMSK